MLIVIIVLSCVIIFLLFRILLFKHIIKSIVHELLKGNYENPVTFSLVDKDMIELGTVINKGIVYHNMQVTEIRKKRSSIKRYDFKYITRFKDAADCDYGIYSIIAGK